MWTARDAEMSLLGMRSLLQCKATRSEELHCCLQRTGHRLTQALPHKHLELILKRDYLPGELLACFSMLANQHDHSSQCGATFYCVNTCAILYLSQFA
jgi:hypothetical protein